PVPMPTLPPGVTRSASTLLVRITSGWASVVPRKLLPGLVPPLPVRNHGSTGVQNVRLCAQARAGLPSGTIWMRQIAPGHQHRAPFNYLPVPSTPDLVSVLAAGPLLPEQAARYVYRFRRACWIALGADGRIHKEYT